MRTGTRLICFNLIGVCFILVGTASLAVLVTRFDSSWRRWRYDLYEKGRALSEVRGAVGYGGMIHSLKNYVLRREPPYIDSFTQSVAEARAGLTHYRSSDSLSAAETADLGLIEEMIDRYEAAMAYAVESNTPTNELDSAIRIDDTPYIAAFDRLVSEMDAELTEQSARLNREIVLGGSLATAGGLLGATFVLGIGSLLASRVGRRLEEQTDAKAKALLELERSKQQSLFLANMSHEIRTPLNAVLGFAQLARDPALTEEERAAHLDTVRRNGRHLMDLVNSVLDLSKIEAGRLGIEPADVSVSGILEEAMSLVGAQAHEKDLRLAVEYEANVPSRVRLDPLRFRQIIVNLVGNAIKFTERGSIMVSVSFEPDTDDTGELRVSVRDTGIGISREALGSIFDSFGQADSSATRKFGGTGLGLHISRRLARMMNGDITVKSRLDEGSEFTAHFPVRVLVGPNPRQRIYAAGAARMSASPLATELRGMRILVVEDGVDNQRLIKHFLVKSGATVVAVTDGLEAIEAVAREGPFDLVLMDMQMPNMDGYEATRRLRGTGYAAPIVALTAHAMSDDRERCLSVGCDDYATKPIDWSHLVDLCASHWHAQHGED